MRIIIIIIPILVCFSQAFSQVIPVDKPELENQRRLYELHINKKVENLLDNLIDKETYVLNTSVILKNLPPQVINISDASDAEALAPRFKMRKDFNSEEAFIPLSKIGDWQENPLEENLGGSKTKSLSTRVRNFSEFIQAIRIDLLLDSDKNNTERLELVREVTNKLLTNSLPTRPVLNIETFKLGTINSKKESIKKQLIGELQKEIQQWREDVKSSEIAKANSEQELSFIQLFAEFKYFVSFILGIIFFGFLGFVAMRKYSSIQDRRLNIEEKLSRKQLDENNYSQDQGSSNTNKNLDEDYEDIENKNNQKNGFAQLSEIISNQPEKAVFLLKQWLYIDDESTHLLLQSLPHQLELDQLDKILLLLNENDRKQWNRINSQTFKKVHPKKLEKILANKIANHLIEPEMGIDEETKQIIATMTANEGARCLVKDPSLGSILASTMPSLQFSKILSLLDENQIQAVANSSSTNDRKQLRYLSVNLEKILTEIREFDKAQSSPFLEKVPELIKELGYTKENVLFNTLAASGNLNFLVETALKFYPSEIIELLPKDIIREVMDQLELVQKAELIFSSQDHRDLLESSLGNGRIRDVIMVEIDEIQTNDIRRKTIERSKDKIWQSFLNQIRSKIRSDDMATQDIQPIVSQWAKEKIEKVSEGRLSVA